MNWLENTARCKYPIFFLLVYLALFIFLSPRFEFPLNDSWAYAKAAKHFCEYGNIRLTDFGAPSQVFQIVYSGLLLKPFGFSFTGLRISIWILSFLSLVALYQIFLMLGIQNRMAFFSCLLLLFNPIYLAQLYSYMTHISFISVMVISIFFFGKAIQKQKLSYAVLSSFFAICCLLTRQQGVLLAFAYFFTILAHWRETQKKPAKILVLFILPVLAFGCFEYWLKNIHGTPAAMVNPWPFTLSGFLNVMRIDRLSRNAFVLFQYLGFFFIPATMAVLFRKHNRALFHPLRIERRLFLTTLLLGLLGVITLYFLEGRLPPYHPKPHYFYNLGIGPKNLTDILILHHKVGGEWALPKWGLFGFAVLCSGSGAILAATVGMECLNLARATWLRIGESKKDKIYLYGNAAIVSLLILTASCVLFPKGFIWFGQVVLRGLAGAGIGNSFLPGLSGKIPDLYRLFLPLGQLMILLGAVSLTGFNLFWKKVGSETSQRHNEELEKARDKVQLKDAGIFLFLLMLLFSIYSLNYDRYLIELFVPAAIVFSAYFGRKEIQSSSILFALALLPLAVFSTVAVRDYVSWNKARWEGLNWLMHELHVEPAKIDGGFEFNGWYTYELVDAPLGQRENQEQGKSWWWVVDNEYVVSFTPIKGYRVIKSIPYSRILGTDEEILVLQRIEADEISFSAQ